MLDTAKARMASFLNTVYPTLEGQGRVLHPDDQTDVLTALRADASAPVVILHAPQLVAAGALATFTGIVSVCALTENDALKHSNALLAALTTSSPVIPTTRLSPMATVLKEDEFWRVAVSFTLRIKA